MADFETWKFTSLVLFAREAQERITDLEALLIVSTADFQTRIDALELALADCDKDRKTLLVELRKAIIYGDRA